MIDVAVAVVADTRNGLLRQRNLVVVRTNIETFFEYLRLVFIYYCIAYRLGIA